MNIQQLETFLLVARVGSFSEAARRLHTTQSTTSMRIHDLEKDLGVRLFERKPGRVLLTPKGRDLARYADQVVHLVAEIRHEVGDQQKVAGSIRMGVAEMVALTWLSDLIKELSRCYPRVVVDLEVGLTRTMTARLATGDLDLLFMPVRLVAGSHFNVVPLGEVDFRWMASSERTSRLGPAPRPETIAAQPIVTLGKDSTLHEIAMEWFQEADCRPMRVDHANTMAVKARLVESGLRMAMLPVDFYRKELGCGKLVLVDTPNPLPPLKFYGAFPPHGRNPLVGLLLDIAKEISTFRQIRVDS